jgi:hypothetical protein
VAFSALIPQREQRSALLALRISRQKLAAVLQA